jgi:anaerobic selenocysteine-containing dehydrogenase
MSDAADKSLRVNRRDFLKFAVFTGAGITLGKYLRDYTLKYETFRERWGEGPGIEAWKLSVCRQCPAGCGLRVRLVDGDAKKLDGNPLCPIARGTTCPKGQAGLQALYDPGRLLGPVRRVGARGAGQWERITWDAALAEVQSKLGALRTQGNPQALAWIAERNDATQGQLIRRFMQAYGSPNLFEFVDLRDEAARAAATFCQGIEEFPGYDLERANYILSFGTPLLESWLSPTWMARQYGHLHRGRKEHRGRFVQIESRLSPTAIKADEWIPANPGTAAALALAIAHVLIREDLYDRAFVEQRAFGFADWIDAAGKEHEGFRTLVLRDFAPDDVTKLTGVPVTTILRLARELATQKPAVAIGEQVPLSGGVALAWAVHALNALNGMVDREGGVLTQRPLPLKPLPDLARQETAQPLVATAASIPGLADAIAAGKPYPVQALFVSSSRFFAVAPESEKFFRAVGKIPFIVSFSSALDDSAAFADLILPDHSPLEKWQDVVPLPVNGAPVWAVSQPALEPLLDTRHTGEVVMELGRKLGGGVAAAFPWKDAPEVLRFVAEGLYEARRGTPFTTPYEGDWTKRLETGGWWIPSAKTFDEFWEQVLKAGGWFDPIYQYERWPRVFKTPSGKFQFVSETQPRPEIAPPQWAGNEREFPLKLHAFTVLTTGTLENPNQPFLQETLAPQVYARWENWVELNPATAQRLGFASGDSVWLESPLGKLRLRARVFAGAMPDVASVLLGHEHRGGGEFVAKRERSVADLVAYRPDAAGLPVAATTRVKLSKVMGGA